MKKKKVGIWIRVSTTRQAEGDSPETHEHRARTYAEMKGWEVVEVYRLEGISGKSIASKKETERMMRDVEQGNITTLIFSELTRFARNTKELLEFAEYFQIHNATLVSLKENIDTSNAMGRLFYTLIAALGQFERETTVERILEANKTRRSLGKMAGGMASFGFKIVNAKLEINEKEAPIRKLMYELFLEHRKYLTVANILNERGYRTRKGYKFHGEVVKGLLTNTDAKGIHRSNHKNRATKENPTGLTPKEQWVFNPCPRIVSDELWNDVNAIIDQKYARNKNTRTRNEKVHLFTGYVFCKKGHPMRVQSKTIKYSCIKCKERIERDILEEAFVSRLKLFPTSQKDQQDYQERNKNIIEAKRKEIQSTQDELAEVEEKMNQLLDLHLAKKIPTKGFDKHYQPLFEKSEQLEDILVTLEQEQQAIINEVSRANEMIHNTISVTESWNTLEKFQKRNIIESSTNRIIIDDKDIIFKFKQLPSLAPTDLSNIKGGTFRSSSSFKSAPNHPCTGTMRLHGASPPRLLKNL